MGMTFNVHDTHITLKLRLALITPSMHLNQVKWPHCRSIFPQFFPRIPPTEIWHSSATIHCWCWLIFSRRVFCGFIWTFPEGENKLAKEINL